MSSITQRIESVSSPSSPEGTLGQRNPADLLALPVVCVGCYVEAHRELPQECTMHPCPKHRLPRVAQIASVDLGAVKATVLETLLIVDAIIDNAVEHHAPDAIVSRLDNAARALASAYNVDMVTSVHEHVLQNAITAAGTWFQSQAATSRERLDTLRNIPLFAARTAYMAAAVAMAPDALLLDLHTAIVGLETADVLYIDQHIETCEILTRAAITWVEEVAQ